MENIIIGLSDPTKAQVVQEIVVKNGFPSTQICISGDESLRLCNLYSGGIVICGYKVGNMMYSDIYDLMPGDYGMLVLLSRNQAFLMDNQEIFSLSMPVNKMDLIKTINMILEIGRKSPSLKRTVNEKQKFLRTIDDNLIIEKAKILLMNKYKISEDSAHRFMQKSSMNRSMKLVEAAKIILRDD